jgi:hypothetical protein
LDEKELREAAPAPLSLDETLLGAGLVTAPIAWALHLTLSYGLVYPAEPWQTKAPFHLTSLLAVVLALFSVVVGAWGLRRARLAAASDPTLSERTRFLATCACLAGAFFLLAIAAQCLPVFMLPLERH